MKKRSPLFVNMTQTTSSGGYRREEKSRKHWPLSTKLPERKTDGRMNKATKWGVELRTT